MKYVTKGLSYDTRLISSGNQSHFCHIISYNMNDNPDLTLLISKVSEAMLPNKDGNHIGKGDSLDNFLLKQPGVRFIINGGFNHYRKNFYDWSHQNYQIGDPVGLVKIRQHYFEDYHQLEHYGFLTQTDKNQAWKIVSHHDLNKNNKYILGCTPLLIKERQKITIPLSLMTPLEIGKINPPSILSHGLNSHARTAIGLKNNTLYFINIEGENGIYDGCSLLELQDIGMQLQLDSLLNLDGGGSAQFRLMTEEGIIKNTVHEDDVSRKLGHVLVLFDETLK